MVRGLAAVALVSGCAGGSGLPSTKELATDAPVTSTSTDTAATTTTATASQCEWIGNWTISNVLCGVRVVDEAIGWPVAIEGVEDEPESCAVLIDNGACVERLQLDNPNAIGTWDVWTDEGCRPKEPTGIGQAETSQDGELLVLDLLDRSVFIIESCTGGELFEFTPSP